VQSLRALKCRRNGCALHTAGGECFPKLAAELLVAIVQQVTTAVQVACALHHGALAMEGETNQTQVVHSYRTDQVEMLALYTDS
jgi:hypothetical protein